MEDYYLAEYMKKILLRFWTIQKSCWKKEASLFFLRSIILFLNITDKVFSLILPKYLLSALGGKQYKMFIEYLLCYAVIMLMLSVLNKFIEPIIAKKKEHLNKMVLDEFLKKSLNIQLKKYDEKDFYNQYLLVFQKCCEIYQNAIDIIFEFIESVFVIIITCMILSWGSSCIYILLIIFTCIQTLISNKKKKIGYDYEKYTIKNNKYLNYVYRLFYVPEYMRQIRLNSDINFIFKKKDEQTDNIINKTYITKKDMAWLGLFSSMLSIFEMILINGYFGYMVCLNKIGIDMFVTSQNSYLNLESAINRVLESFTKLYEQDLFVRDYIEFDLNSSEVISGNRMLDAKKIYVIEFLNVSFSYPNSENIVLKEVSFKVCKNEHILLCGENGSGKTTIMKLLIRLYDPCEGIIKINDIDIREYSIVSLRRAFGTLFQDFALYAFSVNDNLNLGGNIPPKKIQYMLESLGMWEKINNLNKGLYTPISSQLIDEGVSFSSGEVQRLQLAKILLRDGHCLILDEPTSNLDIISEEKIISLILSKKNIMIFLISHNLRYAKRVDKILFLNSGHVEIGTFNELLNLNEGKFKRVYNKLI